MTPDPEAPLLKIEGATVVKNGTRILDDLHLQVAPGQHTAILGPNGSGKSTLIKLITRQDYPLARPDGVAAVTIFGQSRWDVFRLRAQMGIVTADMHQAFTGDAGLRGRDAVLSGFFSSLGLAAHHQVSPDMEGRAEDALRQVEASHLADKPLAHMSTGEARRILIARALGPDPAALLLDEPTAGLDLSARRRFLETLSALARRGRTIILVTHHVEEVIPEISQVVLMRAGRIFAEGPKRDVLTSARLSALFDGPVAVSESGGYYRADFAGYTGA